jgi:dTDP-4-dehydrorhamnose reductase
VVNIAALADFQPGALARLLPVNTLAPGIMAAWCRSHDAYLLQASGTLVHGFSNTRFGPQTPIEPDTDYGRSKWLAEELIRSSGARASLIRLGGIFGVLGPDHLALNCTLRAALEGERPILKGPGNGRRNYLHVDDAARMVAWCVSSNAEGIYWAGGKEIVSLRELLEAVCEVFLPGSAIIEEPGNDAPDQVVEVSPELPSGCTLNEALIAERALHQ